MTGLQICFYTYYGRTHKDQSMPEWLIQLAKELQLPGATMMTGQMGTSHQGPMHTKTWIDDSDEPVQVTFFVTEAQEHDLFKRLELEKVSIFYTRNTIEFGYTNTN